MPQRAETTLVPVLRASIERENLRLEAGGDAGTEPVTFAGHRIGRDLILEWKLRFGEDSQRIHESKTLVEATDAPAAGLDKRSVEHLAAALVNGEALVDDQPQRAPRLRGAVHVSVLAGRNDLGVVFHRGRHVPHRGEAQSRRPAGFATHT